MTKLYEIEWLDWDESDWWLLRGPEMSDDEFRRLCRDHIDDAAKLALQKDDGNMLFIGWNDIAWNLTHVLCEKHDFERVKPTKCRINGSTIVQGDDRPEMTGWLDDVVAHNQEVSHLMKEQRQEQ